MTPIRRGPPPAAPAPARASRPARLARACTPPLLEVRAHAATARPRLAQAHRRFSNLLGYVEANIYIKGAVGGYIKRIKQAASQSRRFLSTLIPPNVLARMATHDRSCSITTCLCDVMLL